MTRVEAGGLGGTGSLGSGDPALAVSQPSSSASGASKSDTGSIVRVPLTHKDPSKSIFTKALHHVRDWKTAVKNGRAFEPYTYVERKTRQATRSTVAYGPLGGELIELAQISYRGIDACQTMYRVLWERLGRSNQKYRNIAKALDVLIYVAVRGSTEFTEMVKRDPNMKPTLERLEGFQYVLPDASARDVGAGVRQKAKDLKRLLEEDDVLEEARVRGEIQSRKMAGMDVLVDVRDGGVAGEKREEGHKNGDERIDHEPLASFSHLTINASPVRAPPHAHSRTLSSESVTSTKGVSEDENALHMEALKSLLARPENLRCADCGLKSPRPSWASVNLGVFLCLRCAGIHRSLGVHVSQVRSCSLDVWTFEQLETVLRCGGNAIANSFWECRLSSKPEMMTIGDVERFVLQKYVEKAYVPSEDMVWPPETIDDEEMEEILINAMGEAHREAYLSKKAERANKADEDGSSVEALHGISLISLMDDDISGKVDLSSEGMQNGGQASGIARVETTEPTTQDFFERVLAGIEDQPAVKDDPYGNATHGIALEAPPPATAVAPPLATAVAPPPATSSLISSEVSPKATTSAAEDDLSLLFSLDDSIDNAMQAPISETKSVSAQERPGPVLEHERKAIDMMTETLLDFDISSSIAKSVSPRSRPKSSMSTNSPMRSG